MARALPSTVVFDVNGTLSDLSPMQEHFTRRGLPPPSASLWFATVLRDGFALAAAGAFQPFSSLAEAAARGLFWPLLGEAESRRAVSEVMAGFAELSVHADVPGGVAALSRLGCELAALTNGSASTAAALLERAGLRDAFGPVLSVDDAGAWKPQRGAYELAARVLARPPEALLLVAEHPWDIDGAARAGLATAWVNRAGGPYPGVFRAPDLVVRDLEELAAELG